MNKHLFPRISSIIPLFPSPVDFNHTIKPGSIVSMLDDWRLYKPNNEQLSVQKDVFLLPRGIPMMNEISFLQ